MTTTSAEAQALRYAEELSKLITLERAARRKAEANAAALQASYVTTVRALAASLDLRDDATGAHAQRVTALGLELARAVAPELLVDEQLEFGFLLHDVGKIGVPDAILLKADALDAAETELMRRHTVLGEQIVADIPYLGQLVRAVVRNHHERWDGGGYPDRIAGEDIPFPARMFSIVDSYDAMTSDRPYRCRMTGDEAAEQLLAEAGRQFDPALVPVFLEVVGIAR